MDWNIEYYYRGDANERLVEELLSEIVSPNKTNEERFTVEYYSIIGDSQDAESHRRDLRDSGVHDPLTTIREEYRKMEQDVGSITVGFGGLGERSRPFTVSIIQISDGTVLVLLGTNTHYTDDMPSLAAFIDLSRDIFEQFDFVYGAYRHEHEGTIPLDYESILDTPPHVVTLYSEELADDVGRELLLSAPAERIEELGNGGIFLLACYDQYGSCGKLLDVRRHLGFEGEVLDYT